MFPHLNDRRHRGISWLLRKEAFVAYTRYHDSLRLRRIGSASAPLNVDGGRSAPI